MKQLRALFSGMVQGVGFRFTTERLARYFHVTGYVRNLPDGKVELVAEGKEEILQDFLKAVCESSLARYIQDVETEWGPSQGAYTQFGVVV